MGIRRKEGGAFKEKEELRFSGGGGQRKATLKVLQWNCDHLMAKKAELEDFLEDGDIDVALLQETKLRMEDTEVRVRGYEVIRKDRRREGMRRLARGEDWSL